MHAKAVHVTCLQRFTLDCDKPMAKNSNFRLIPHSRLNSETISEQYCNNKGVKSIAPATYAGRSGDPRPVIQINLQQA